MNKTEKTALLLNECWYKAVTSGGKGGQNVNKVATKIELYFDVNASQILSEDEKQLLLKKLSGKLNDEGILRVTSSEERTQYKNKKLAGEKFSTLIFKALTVRKKRKKTKPTDASVEERIKNKKIQSEKKKLRSKSG